MFAYSTQREIAINLSGTARRGRVFHTPGTCQIAYKIIISGKLIFFYWQLLIILFAVDIAKKNGIIPLCASRREKYISGAADFGAAAPLGAARSWLSYPTA